jgi:hypothetical protein
MRPFLIILMTAALLATTGQVVRAGKPKIEQPWSDEQIYARLDQIVFPAVKFENTPIREVVRTLVVSSRQHDRSRKGVDIILKQPPTSISPSSKQVAVAGQQMDCKINFTAGMTSLRMMLDEICRQCEFDWAAADMMGKSAYGGFSGGSGNEQYTHNIVVQLSPRGLVEKKPQVPEKPRK